MHRLWLRRPDRVPDPLIMTATQLQRLLDRAHQTQSGMAQQIGISDRNMRRYCAGDLPIPRPVELAIRYVLKHGTDRPPSP
jgi:hypothetical protein